MEPPISRRESIVNFPFTLVLLPGRVNRRSRNLYSVWMTADWGARVVSVGELFPQRVASIAATNSQWTIYSGNIGAKGEA